jgi:hypothetical protein
MVVVNFFLRFTFEEQYLYFGGVSAVMYFRWLAQKTKKTLLTLRIRVSTSVT